MKYALIVLTLVITTLLTACGENNVSAKELESQKQIALDNAESNAQMFRANDTRFANHKVINAPDSTQNVTCPMGDGWASLTLMNPENGTRTKIKCSTYSAATGCLLDQGFVTKPYAPDDGKCQKDKVPYPLEKLAK